MYKKKKKQNSGKTHENSQNAPSEVRKKKILYNQRRCQKMQNQVIISLDLLCRDPFLCRALVLFLAHVQPQLPSSWT